MFQLYCCVCNLIHCEFDAVGEGDPGVAGDGEV